MTDRHRKKAVDAIIDQATEWIVQLQDPQTGSAEKRAFINWLQCSPEHIKAYLSVETTWAALEGIDPQRDTDVDELLRSATNVVHLESDSPSVEAPAGRALRWPKWAIAAAGVVTVAVLGLFAFKPDPLLYQTGVGEQRRIVLNDGSVIELNTNSKIEVVFNSRSREVQLVHGEALFTVAKDPQRPFNVNGHQAQVQVLGTQFNVYQKRDQTTVSVLEGLVSVRDKRPDSINQTQPGSVQLTAGYELKIDSDKSALAPVAANIERATAWRQQRLIFENDTLADAIDEFNRYNRKQLTVLDTKLAGQRINGVFDSGRPEALVRFLVQSGVAKIVKQTDLHMVVTSP